MTIWSAALHKISPSYDSKVTLADQRIPLGNHLTKCIESLELTEMSKAVSVDILKHLHKTNRFRICKPDCYNLALHFPALIKLSVP